MHQGNISIFSKIIYQCKKKCQKHCKQRVWPFPCDLIFYSSFQRLEISTGKNEMFCSVKDQINHCTTHKPIRKSKEAKETH